MTNVNLSRQIISWESSRWFPHNMTTLVYRMIPPLIIKIGSIGDWRRFAWSWRHAFWAKQKRVRAYVSCWCLFPPLVFHTLIDGYQNIELMANNTLVPWQQFLCHLWSRIYIGKQRDFREIFHTFPQEPQREQWHWRAAPYVCRTKQPLWVCLALSKSLIYLIKHSGLLFFSLDN